MRYFRFLIYMVLATYSFVAFVLGKTSPYHPTLALVLGGICFYLALQEFTPPPTPQQALMKALQKWVTWELLQKHEGLSIAGDRGDPNALELSQTLLAELPEDVCLWLFVNVIVCTMITNGHYLEALEVPEHWSPEAQAYGEQIDPQNALLTSINLAEAEYNLGWYNETLQRLEGITDESQCDPMEHAGLWQQKAWTFLLKKQTDKAREALSAVVVEDFPPEYHAEHHYTWGFLYLQEGKTIEARQRVEQGIQAATRTTSQRNGLFLLAEIAKQTQQTDTAIALFEQGIEHPYQRQGGSALASYYQLLVSLGNTERAAEIKALLIQRDPQSAEAQSFGNEAPAVTHDKSDERCL